MLTEKRDANVKTIQVNLVNYAPAELYKELYLAQSEGVVE